MADASFAVTGFLGGEISQFAQGRFDKPDYKISLNVCLNSFPVEIGAWTRRPGTQFAGTTKNGLNARVIRFDFQAANPYVMEFGDGSLRFWSGANLATTNDSVGVLAISSANPAVVQTAVAVTWVTGDEAYFSGLGTTCPTLQNRRFTLTKNDTTHFALADSVTGTNINGALLNVPATNTVINRVQNIVTPYVGQEWMTKRLRSVQTENTSFLLNPRFPPQQVTVTQLPADNVFAQFSLAQSFFQDGPYLDPVPGSIITASAVTGIVTLTASVPAYSATVAYTIGQFVLSSGITYQSLQDANINNTPAGAPTFWKVVTAGAPINNGQGFVASDIGRLVRLFSEPNYWASTTTYAIGDLVSYNPSGLPGAETYWSGLTAANVNHVPGTDTKNWTLVSIGGATGSTIATAAGPTVGTSPALWSWGKITALSSVGAISGTLAGSTNIGNLTGGGGLTAAFDGTVSKKASVCANALFFSGGASCFVGKNYTSPGAQTIAQAVVYPSKDYGIENHNDATNGNYNTPKRTVTINLWAKASAPANSRDGTLLATATTDAASKAPVTLVSNDIVSTWNYVWVEPVPLQPQQDGPSTPFTRVNVGQVVFYTASAVPGTAVSLEILGPPLLYAATPINTWRLGVYSDTTGWPTVGTYSDGRLWLSGSIPNRIDASVANGINGINNNNIIGSVNFAPTDQYGNVLASSGLSYVFNAPDANTIFWMAPTLQGIIAGTLAGEWLIQAPTSGGISPLNISARRVTKIGAANVEPRATEHTYIFVQRYSVKLMEYFADIFSGKFTAPNLADKAQHITSNGIAEIAYVHSATPIIWGRDNSGNLFGCTYKRDSLMTSQGPTYYAWHRHNLGSGRDVVSLCSGPSVGGTLDSLTMVTYDGATYHVEIMTDTLDELATLQESWFLDDAVIPTSILDIPPS